MADPIRRNSDSARDETTLEDAARLVRSARYVIALTGAGISVESGIPPFRGPGGLWTRFGEPPLNGFQEFLADPRAAWEKRLHPVGPMAELWKRLTAARPNPGHHALVRLEQRGILRCVITQNIDDLHRAAGQRSLAEIHGNAKLTRCLECGARRPLAEVKLDELPPRCESCAGLVKSDTVSFGEPIPEDVLEVCQAEVSRADCILVVGTSATVYPAASFPFHILERGGSVIEVNPGETELTPSASLTLFGSSGQVLTELADAL